MDCKGKFAQITKTGGGVELCPIFTDDNAVDISRPRIGEGATGGLLFCGDFGGQFFERGIDFG